MVASKKIVPFLLVGMLLFLTACSDKLGDRYTAFAQCLTDKGAKFYGAYWCPKCDKQKKMFGKSAVKKMPYIECDPRGEDAEPRLCLDKKIEFYPTWDFSDGTREVGVQELEDLAEKTECSLPTDERSESDSV